VNGSMKKRLTIFGGLIVLAMGVTAGAFAQDQHHGADPHHPVKPDSAGSHPDHVPNPGMHDKEHNITGHEAAHHGPEAINWTDIEDHHRPAFIALVVNFGVLVVGYYLIGKKPVSEALKQRRVTIGKAIEDAQAMLGEAKERAKKYQADLKNADTDAADAKAALIAAGKGEVERNLLEANEKADRMKRDADRLVDQERKQIQHDLLKETIDLAVKEAARTLEKTVTAEDHARLADDLLKELAAKPAVTVGGQA
jgi:F-type H+-transporting ATPase subunit b